MISVTKAVDKNDLPQSGASIDRDGPDFHSAWRFVRCSHQTPSWRVPETLDVGPGPR